MDSTIWLSYLGTLICGIFFLLARVSALVHRPLGATAFALELANNPETHVALNAPCTVVLLLPRLPCPALPCPALPCPV
jgi:hypothetical protein